MRLFQVSSVYRSYLPRAEKLVRGVGGYKAQIARLLADRYGAVHLLQPIRDGDPDGFFTYSNDTGLQRAWADEQGMASGASPADILLAQIEHHRTEVFYNQDPTAFGNAFLKRLPGSVKRTIAWWAAPAREESFLDHDVVVNNFPSLLEGYRNAGIRAEYFAPAHDPEMDSYAANRDRPVDILFVGGYSRHHSTRARALNAIAALRGRYRVRFCLDRSRMTQLAETPLGLVGPLRRHRRPSAIRRVSSPAVFGTDLYDAIGGAKLVINGAVDMAGKDRGNMRCWETMGCGAAMVSDAGVYPDGMTAGDTMLTYATLDEMLAQIEELLADEARRTALADRAHAMISTEYSGEAQWRRFQQIAA
jgi:hypothetical protein